MTYKLAKELKDAGFPQDYSNGIYNGNFAWRGERLAYKPPLSELIKACGSYFYKLQRSYDSPTWEVYGNNGEPFVEKTPEEAVAKLWLKFNEK